MLDSLDFGVRPTGVSSSSAICWFTYLFRMSGLTQYVGNGLREVKFLSEITQFLL